jgi:hypothetical protein
LGDGTFIDGVSPEQHQYVEGPVYEGPGPEGEDPVRWETLVCENCGYVFSGWTRMPTPVFV